MIKRVSPGPLKGLLVPPADKSISHRALLLAALATGESRIGNLLLAGDVISSWECLKALGVRIEQQGNDLIVHGMGGLLRQPLRPLYLGNSGTTMRLLSGILAAQPLQVVLTGDDSLNRRPIERVLDPLRLMGAEVCATAAGTPPVQIVGKPLIGINYTLPVPSAQLKSAILLAAIQARGRSSIVDPIPSRDHTERMLVHMGVSLVRDGDLIVVDGPQQLAARELHIPGDFSSAAPFITAAVLDSESQLKVSGVGLNPTRTGLLTVLARMGAEINIELQSRGSEEPFGELVVSGSKGLIATEVTAAEIPLMIDEVPLLVVAACFARGTTIIQGVEELRVKESDRVESIVQPLRRLGAKIEVVGNSLAIEGLRRRFDGKEILSAANDHRIAMALAVAASLSEHPCVIDGAEWVDISYPEFFTHLEQLQEEGRCAL